MAAKKKKAFSITVAVNGELLSAAADTLDAAILALPAFKPKTKGVVTVAKNGILAKPMILNIPMLNRLFYPGMTGNIQRIALAKRYATLT